MITPAYVRTMAAYNREMNLRIYGAAARLSDEERRAERGVFWGSLHATLGHILWADRMWMWRFEVCDKPERAIADSGCNDMSFAAIRADRDVVDGLLTGWADRLQPSWFEGELNWYSGAKQRDVTADKGLLVTHLFNHQTHHRGQAHALLTRLGEKTSDTDLWLVVPKPL